MALTTHIFERRLSPDALPGAGTLRVLALQIRSELLKTLRMPDFMAAGVLLPVVLFVLFGAPTASNLLPDGRSLGPHVVASFGAYGILGIVLFAFGEGIAVERGHGWLRLVRATPLNPLVYLAGKLVLAALAGALILAILFPVAAVVAGVEMEPERWLTLAVVLVAAAVPLAPIGFLIGFWARPGSAGAISLLLYLPLSYVSGLWQPVAFLPEPVRRIAGFLPTYHYAELARASIGLPSAPPLTSLAWLIGAGVLFGAVALWGYRRTVGQQFA